MKKFKHFILSVLAVLVLVSCSTVQTSVRIDYMESSTENLEPQNMIMTSPMIADLKVIGDQITYTETEAFKDIEVTRWVIDAIPNFKRIALCKAARQYNADLIIGATIDVVTTPLILTLPPPSQLTETLFTIYSPCTGRTACPLKRGLAAFQNMLLLKFIL